MSQIKTNEFLDLVLKETPRLLGQLNRNPSSKSYGSFDRAYWHYRTNDISACRYQEAVYTLALLYRHHFEGNIYYADEKMLEWIRASLRFSVSIQRPNGSFDEWYINEGSFVGTAFLTAALCQTLELFKGIDLLMCEEALVLPVIEKSARFLLNNKEDTAMNQVSGAIFAIVSAANLLNKQDFTDAAKSLMADFLKKQNSEGWWSEYGGPDIGYLSLTISYLCKYQKLISSSEVTSAIINAKTFVENFIHPDHTAGGEYMSRNTEYLIPSEYLPYVGAIKPENLDDRYLCYILYNWLEAGLVTFPKEWPVIRGEKYFKNSKILRVSTDSYMFISNGSKGGSFRVYADSKAYYDSGLEIKFGHNAFSSGILDCSNKVTFKPGELVVEGNFKRISEPLFTTPISIAFKVWQLMFGRAPTLQGLIKKVLRTKMVSYSSASPINFQRKVNFRNDRLSISDFIGGTFKASNIIYGVKAAYNAVPSSKYAPVPELVKMVLKPKIEIHEYKGGVEIKRNFKFENTVW